MSRDLFGLEKGIRIFEENSDNSVEILSGSGSPSGLGDFAQAPIGSLYIRRDVGQIYQKIANAGASEDWELNGTGSTSVLPIFKDITTRVATGDVVVAGTVDVTAFSDNESGIDGTAFTVGEYLLSGVGGTPLLWEVTEVNSATDITVVAADPALADNDGLIVRAYLPDSPADQENTAGVMYQNGTIVKLFDVDWSVATGIVLSAGFASQNGTVQIGDSVEVAIEKLAGNQEDLTTLTGVAQGSTNHGAMDQGEILSDNATTNALFKETDKELTRQRGKSSSLGVTAVTTVDSVLVDDVAEVVWHVMIEDASDKTRKRAVIVHAIHDGTDASDASLVDDNVSSRLRLGATFNRTVQVDISGTGASQVMRLRVTSTEPSGVNVYAKRIETLY